MAMTTMTCSASPVVGGVDTHKDRHVAAVVDAATGQITATGSFVNDRRGYRRLLRWMQAHGPIERVGLRAPVRMGPGWRGS
jgi:transposase